MTWHATSEFLKPRQWLGIAAAIILWICWFISMGMGDWVFDRFKQLYAMDHLAFYTAGKLVNEGKDGKLYDYQHTAEYQAQLFPERWGGLEAFRNPPFYALLYTPTAHLPYFTSAIIWQFVALACLILGIRLLGLPRPWITALWAFSFYPVFCVFSYGQNSLLSFLVFCVTYRCHKNGHPFWAGFFAGLLWFKPTLLTGLFLWWLLEWRQYWRSFIGVITMGTLLTLGTYPIVPEAWWGFVNTLQTNLKFDDFPWVKNHTPRAFFRLLIPGLPGKAEGLITLAFALVAIAVFLRLWVKQRSNLAIMFGGVVFLTLWSSAHALVYEWAIVCITAILWWHAAPALQHRLRVLYTVIWIMMFFITDLNDAIEKNFKPKYILQFSVPVLAWFAWLVVQWLRNEADKQNESAKPDTNVPPTPLPLATAL